MVKRGQNPKRLKNNSPISVSAVWSGYNESYIQNIVSGAMKALTLLSVLTFDPGLLFWTKGLENHLKKRMEEAKKELQEIEKYKF